MRCSRCGNENPATNRFCGMCGASLLPSSALPPPPPVVSRADVPRAGAPPVVPVRESAVPVSAAPRPPAHDPAPDSSQVPIISGPSFLGLNQPAPSSSRRETNLKRDAHQERSSRNLDYLLEDEEEPRSGAWKFVLILIALALAVGFGYLRWSSGGFAWLTNAAKKPPVTAQTPDAAQSSSTTDAPSTTPDSASTPSVSQPTATGTSSPPSGSTAAENSPAPTAAAPSATPAASTATGTEATSPAAPATTTASKDTASPADTSDYSAAAPKEKASEPPPARPAAKPRAAAKPAPVTPVDPVAQAERYIYGRGVTQDCDRGLRMLRPAAEHSNSKAMISLGALYSAGLCTPRDLPTAYRWFALALRREPDNQPVQTDLQKLWSEMTPPERQLAIKLSQ